MSDTHYRCAVIGCGWIGAKVSADPLADGVQSHAQAYDKFEETELVGLCDPDMSTLSWACNQWPSANGYDDLARMLLQEQPDIVSVCTPDDTHYAVCRQLLETSSIKAIVLEKPMATNVTDAMALLLEARARNIMVMVNYRRRFARSHQAIKQQIVAGNIGVIVAVSGVYSKGILHNGSHWIDLVHWLVDDIATVEAWEGSAPFVHDPTCHVRIQFEGGAQGFLLGVDESKFSMFELDLVGTLGRIRIRDSGHQIEQSYVQKSEYYSGYYALGPSIFEKAGFQNAALHLVENTVKTLRKEEIALCSGQDALAALVVVDTIRRSLNEKKCLNINYL